MILIMTILTWHTILGIWIDSNMEVMYALATRITFICPMRFNAFPMDIQVKEIKEKIIDVRFSETP